MADSTINGISTVIRPPFYTGCGWTVP